MTCHTPYSSSLGNLEAQYCFFFLCFSVFGPKVYAIPAPQPGIKPVPDSLEGEVLTTGLLEKSLRLIKKKKKMYYRGLNIYLKLISVTHNRSIDLHTHTKTLIAVISAVGGIVSHSFVF